MPAISNVLSVYCRKDNGLCEEDRKLRGGVFCLTNHISYIIYHM